MMTANFSIISIIVCLVSLFVGYTYSQTLLLGPCPEPPVQENFSAQEFMGRWYEIERSFVMAEVGWQCISTDYKQSGDNVRVETIGRAVVRRVMTAQATFTPSNPAKIVLRGEGSLPTQSTNNILFTDYSNVAVVWSCRNSEPLIPISGLGFFRNLTHTENLWILSRRRNLEQEYKKMAYDFLDLNAISRRSLRTVSQDNCQDGGTITP